jgi:hypothetical protein
VDLLSHYRSGLALSARHAPPFSISQSVFPTHTRSHSYSLNFAPSNSQSLPTSLALTLTLTPVMLTLSLTCHLRTESYPGAFAPPCLVGLPRRYAERIDIRTSNTVPTNSGMPDSRWPTSCARRRGREDKAEGRDVGRGSGKICHVERLESGRKSACPFRRRRRGDIAALISNDSTCGEHKRRKRVYHAYFHFVHVRPLLGGPGHQSDCKMRNEGTESKLAAGTCPWPRPCGVGPSSGPQPGEKLTECMYFKVGALRVVHLTLQLSPSFFIGYKFNTAFDLLAVLGYAHCPI